MIIWINGAFGAGKTTVAESLTQEIDNALLYDPELVGVLAQRILSPAPGTDFQDLPFWRDTVVSVALHLRRHHNAALIVPMTLIEPTYLHEVFEKLAAAGESLIHVFLDVDEATLVRRINAQTFDAARDVEIRQWRLAQIGRCRRAKFSLPSGTVILDGILPVNEIVAAIKALIAARIASRP